MPDPEEKEQEVEVTDKDAADDVINEAEPNIEDSPQFKGLLRDRQADRATLSHINAENVAYKQEVERLQKQIEDAKKPTDTALTEEEAAEEVTRGQLHTTLAEHGRKLIDNVTKIISAKEAQSNQANLKKNQAADAQALKKTCTAKTKGLSLDAKTVVDEAIAYLSANDPEYLEFLSKQPDFATRLYQLATGEPLVPTVGQRVTLRRNTILAKKLDQKGDDVLGGGSPSGDELSVFEAIISSGVEMSDEALEKMIEP